MTEPEIEAILRGGSSRRPWLVLSIAVAVIAAAAVAAFLLIRTGETDVVVEPQRVEATLGRLSTEVELSGSAIAERSTTLSFDAGGVVASVAVSRGDEVREGATLATLEGTAAQRRVETAQVQLRQAQLRLDNLLAGPEESAVASASQAIASARSQVLSAERNLALLAEPPSTADLASAEQAVAAALRELSGTEQAQANLSEPPSAADLASAEQAVATARRELSSAEQALAELADPPDTSELRSTEQAVASALVQLSSAEQDLADLLAGPTEAQFVEARSAVTQAQVQLSTAKTSAEEMMEALTEASDDFCEGYGALGASDTVIRETCNATLPLTDPQVDALRDSFEDRSVSYENLGNALIDANVAFVSAAADRDSAHSALTSAEESLSDLLQVVSEEDVYQAEQALEAARASHAAAVARLEDLRATADEGDVFRAQQALEAASASHEAAIARLSDLRAAAGEEDVYQAQQAVEAARASHAAAVARMEDLRAAADDADVRQAQATLESAQASLASAQAQYNELVAGPTGNAIEQQRQDLRLAELSLEETLEALADLTIFAPFDGVVEDVAVRPGDIIAANSPAFTLSTSGQMLVSLTVTEEDLLDLEVGQTGLATFDAIDGVDYPVRVESITRVPNAEQGVVTYEVEARILLGEDGSEGSPRGPEGNAGTRGAFGGGGLGGAFGGGFGGGFGEGVDGGPFSGIELPEGVTPQQVLQAIVSGQPLPEGVVIPDEIMQMIESFRAGGGFGRGAGGQQGPGARQEPAPEPGDVAGRPLPAPGMSASVTILTEVREESVLLPTSAIRQLEGRWFVSVPAPAGEGGAIGFERVFVEIGVSDGERVEVSGGLDAGSVVLTGADNAGIAFTATLQQPSAIPGFDPGRGAFGPPGGGGRR